jgi:phosphoribosylaminoimidazolecarboxamide formyltransferase/IMP cyclohydrolase
MKEHGIAGIDLVVINLYPFEATVAKPGVKRDEAIEQIDIGGPSMVRSAAKNHRFVGIVTDPADYGRVLDELQRNGGALSDGLRRALALKAFQTTSRYDAAISAWLFEQERADGRVGDAYPEVATLAWFFAAPRTIDGPPMSICSMHSSGLAPEATVAVKG